VPELDECDLTRNVIRFICNNMTAPALVESFEAFRENAPTSLYERALARLAQYDHEQLYADIASDALDPAKGRLWCASLIQQLLPPHQRDTYAESPVDDESPIELEHDNSDAHRAAADASDSNISYDGDCETINANAIDVRIILGPTLEPAAPFAANDDVFGFWHGDCCVLINASRSLEHSVRVPLRHEEATEVIAGYGLPISNGHATVHLWQLGSAIVHSHEHVRLQRPMDPGLGVLAHVTSLPTSDPNSKGAQQMGTLGAPARAFIDWLADAGVHYWQVLPVNPIDMYSSPYSGTSALAGNSLLLEGGEEAAFDTEPADASAYREFCEREADWLEPYAAFMAIREVKEDEKAWYTWRTKYRVFSQKLLDHIAADAKLSEAAERWRRAQFTFECQWQAVRSYANERGIQIIGDMPIYVSTDSADVWAHTDIFQLEADGTPSVVAGCPPDRFAADGQVWGNPVYDWDALRKDGYSWWLRRLERAFNLYDYVRLDHFIGFAHYFSIPAGEKGSAGAYHPGPGVDFFRAAFEKFGPLPLIAEDLGSITPAIRALGSLCGFPGMDIMQFVDGNDPLSGYTPRPEKIVYTGTHDNNTIVGYCVERYPNLDPNETADKLVDLGVACDADVVVLPLQDVLGLDDEARMNIPGTAEGNWAWRADASDVAEASARLRELADNRKAHQPSHT
jgi:4-alpha-glucanotransferase